MKIHVVQKNINNSQIEPFLDDARAKNVDLICFGELATSGAVYEPREVESLDSLLTRLRPYDISIMIGLPLKTSDCMRNTYMYYDGKNFNSGDKPQFYNKIKLFPDMNEPEVYKAGENPGLFETEYGRSGVAICYDIRFPDLFKKIKKLGVDFLVIPAAFPIIRIHQWREMVIERARDCKVPVIAINSVGKDSKYEFGGCSIVVDSSGKVLAEADNKNETVLELDLNITK